MLTPPEGFDAPQEIFDGEVSSPVFRSLEGELPIIVLHELPGMTPSFIEYCQHMVKEGFKVYMPLLFKDVGSEMSTGQTIRFCLDKEFRHLFSARAEDGSRPISNWLLHLTKHVAQECPNQKIGMIGMCLTGGFALVGLADPSVAGVICCQPSYPFFFNQSIGLTSSQREKVSDGAKRLPKPCVKGFRYDKDWICRKSHFNAIENLLDDAFDKKTLPGRGHSTVTGSCLNKRVFDEIVVFLNRQLKAS